MGLLGTVEPSRAIYELSMYLDNILHFMIQVPLWVRLDWQIPIFVARDQ